MTSAILHDHGLVLYDIATPADAESATAAYCAARGLDDWDVLELDLPRRIRRAWWGGDEVGFVDRDYPAAVEVVVVSLPEYLLIEEA